jgi:hypothetical protein
MRYVRFILALLLIPLMAALVWNFCLLVIGLGKSVSLSVVPFWVGLGGYFVFQVVFSRPIRTYVFGHELTHALVGTISVYQLGEWATAHIKRHNRQAKRVLGEG